MSLRKIVVCDMCRAEMDVEDEHHHIKGTRKPDRDIFSNNMSWSQPEYLDFCPRCYERIRQFVIDQRDTGTMA